MKKEQHNIDEWSSIFRKWLDSGLSGARWCRENDVPINAFRYWLSKFREDGLFQTTVKPADNNADNAFVELSFEAERRESVGRASTQAAEMTILLKDYTVLIHKGVSSETLTTVMEVLTHA